jgi:acyl-CoA thioesterase FadM
MSRIKIEVPEQLPFRTKISIRISDINYGGHVGNDSILSILHEARLQWLKEKGMTELNFFGAGLIMRDAAILFRSEMFHGEEVEVALGPEDVKPTGFELYYRITRLASGTVAVLAKTGMVHYDYAKKKIAVLSEEDLLHLTGKGHLK